MIVKNKQSNFNKNILFQSKTSKGKDTHKNKHVEYALKKKSETKNGLYQ